MHLVQLLKVSWALAGAYFEQLDSWEPGCDQGLKMNNLMQITLT